MKSFSEKLQEPYQRLTNQLAETTRYGEELHAASEPTVNEVPVLIENVHTQTLAHFEKQRRRLDERMQPLDLRSLTNARKKLFRLDRLTWRVPQAFKLRLLNFFYRSAIFTVRLLQLALVLLLIYGILRLVWIFA